MKGRSEIFSLLSFLTNTIQGNAMPPDSTSLFKLLGMSRADFYNFVMLILTIIGTVATVIGTVVAVRSVKSKREVKRIQSALSRRPASNFFPSEAIARAIRYYVHPDISTDNPTHDDKGVDKLSREPLFEAIDKFLAADSPFHHFFPNDAAIQRKTGIRRYDSLAAGQSAEWEFSTRYLMPLSDQMVKTRRVFCQRQKSAS
jgi:hypothetical protein